MSSSRTGSRARDEIKLVFQEIERGKEAQFIVQVLGILRTQEQVFSHLGAIMPEISDPIWLDQRVPAFRGLVDELFTRFGRSR